MIKYILFFLFFVSPALAADDTKVDFGPFVVQYVLPALGAILTALAAWAVQALAARSKMQNTAVLADLLNTAVTHGLAFAQTKVAAAAAGGVLSVDVKNQVVKNALDYAMTHAPDAATKLGYTPDKLTEKIEATLAVNTTPPEKSLAVPTPPTS